MPAAGLLSFVGSLFPNITENYYSTGINRVVIHYLSVVTGFLPFSLAEMLVIFLVVLAVWKIMRAVVELFKMQKVGMAIILNHIVNLLAFVSIVYFIFILLWGLNYNRINFANIAHFSIQPATTEELANVCNSLIERTNQLRMKVDKDPNSVMKVSGGKARILNGGDPGYQKAATIYPELGGRYGNPKGILLSEPMSYLGLAGVYFPFTGEANVNMAVPDIMLPCTVCHEMAHQRGFAREDEANYIAYLTCKLNPDPDFQYSGNLLAVIYSMNMLKKYDIERFMQLQQSYSKGVRKDLEYYSAFLKIHESKASRIISNVNDLYLKSNRQGEGVYSYDRMVDLLIAEFRTLSESKTGPVSPSAVRD
jgi:hypothetical protein